MHDLASDRRHLVLAGRDPDRDRLVADATAVALLQWLVQTDSQDVGHQLHALAQRDPSLCAWLADQLIAATPRQPALHDLPLDQTAVAPGDALWVTFPRWVEKLRRANMVRLFAESMSLRKVSFTAFDTWRIAQAQSREVAERARRLPTEPPYETAMVVGYVAAQLAPRGRIAGEDWDLVDQPVVARSIDQHRTGLSAYLAQSLVREPTDAGDSATDPIAAAMLSVVPAVFQLAARQLTLETRFEVTLEREKLAAMKELAYGASHEINNPLANISSRAQLLMRDEPNPERRRALATINSQAFRAHEMIADMMLFAKPPAPQFETVALGAFLDEILPPLKKHLPVECHLEWHIEDRLPQVRVDRIQLTEAIKAIWTNAIEAMGETGRLLVSARADADGSWSANGDPYAVIEITDNGPGIEPEVRRHLFDPFYSGREAGRGLGFGLAKAWRIVQLNAGRIEVRSDAGHGATFSILLPVFRGGLIDDEHA